MDLDLSAVEQLVESSQVRTIADAIQKARSLMDGKRTLEVHMNTPVRLCLCLSAYADYVVPFVLAGGVDDA